MSSNKENVPSANVPSSLRRSKRIMTSNNKRILRSDVAKKTAEKPMKRSAGKTNWTHRKKSKLNKLPKKQQSPDVVEGSYLTSEELQQLLIKYTRDGHFRLIPSNPSPPPLVISRTNDGKFITTKIECHGNNRQVMSETASTFTSQNTVTQGLEEASDSTAVIFSVPVEENPPANASYTGASADPLIYVRDENFEAIRTNNCNETTLNALPDQEINFAVDNAVPENSAGPNPPLRSISTAVIRPMIPPARPNPTNLTFAGPASSTWIPPSQSTLGNSNGSNTSGIYYPNNDAQYGRISGSQGTATINGDGSRNLPGNLDPNLPNRYNYPNLPSGSHGANYQPREPNAQEPLQIPPANSWVSSGSWNAGGQTSSNASSSGYGVAGNSQTGHSNSQLYGMPLSNPSTSASNAYPYVPAWNSNQYYPNSYVPAANTAPYNNTYSGQHEPELITGDQDSHVNSSSQDSQNDDDLYDGEPTGSDNFSPFTLDTFSSDATIDDSDFDSEADLSQSSNEQTENWTSGRVSDYSQNVLLPLIPPIGSYNNVSYQNYMAGNIAYGNGNLDQRAQGNGYSSQLPSVSTIRPEMRFWYGGGNYAYGNSEPLPRP